MRTKSTAASPPGSVVHVVEALGGGVLHVVQAYANATAGAGIPTVVLHGRRPQTPAAHELRLMFRGDVELIEVPGWGRRRPFASIRSAASANNALRRELHRRPPGILHLHSSYAGVVGRLMPPPRGWQAFYSPHAYAFLGIRRAFARFAVRFVERTLISRATTVAVSRTEAAIAQSLRGNVVLVPNGVDPVPTTSDARSNIAPRICVVGRADAQRAPDLLCAAAPRLRGFDLVWVGDGCWRGALEANGVKVTGWMPRDRVREQLSSASVVLHLARYDGLPLALIEAMTAAKPIVALEGQVAREVLEGCAVFVSTAEDAAAALQDLVADPERARSLGLAAQKRALTEFSCDRMIGALLDAYSARSAAPRSSE